ncbi:unnamed protein product [Gemmata massiliana]|uniref:Uncharacterized protein n=1 Tax=Gemmata massiliana TaxID=1210884 RepID=A0A6P2D1D8_9BACT|nr:hypothetical protein [Gemmata massiliana]VTR95081.1 unnamed protein product [Gemmata massiliana]
MLYKDTLKTYSKGAVVQKGNDCDFVTDEFLQAYKPLFEGPIPAFWRRVCYGWHPSGYMVKQAQLAPTIDNLVQLHAEHGPVKIHAENIAETGTRFTSGFHCVVLVRLIRIEGRLAALLYDPEGIAQVHEAEKLISAAPGEKGPDTSDDHLLVQSMLPRYRIVYLDEFLQKARFTMTRSGFHISMPRN